MTRSRTGSGTDKDPASGDPDTSSQRVPGTGSAEGGLVSLQGCNLVVTPPARMTSTALTRLATRLGALCDAKTDGRDQVVPIRHAAALEAELTQTWPGMRHAWTWTVAARAAADRVAGHTERLTGALGSTENDLTAAELDELLRGGGYTRTLLDKQVTAVSRLVTLGSGGNFSVPGSGKTTMTLAVYAALRARGDVDRLLVVAPLSAHEAWTVETAECFDDEQRPSIEIRPTTWSRRSEITVVNYERASHAGTGAAYDRWAAGHRVMVVYDEAHRAKRGDAGLHGAAAAALANRATHRLVLTGTPMPNSVDDLAAVLDLAWPGHGSRLATGDLATTPASAWVRLSKADLELDEPDIVHEAIRLDDQHRKVYTAVATQTIQLDAAGLLDEHPELARHAIVRTLAVAANPAAVLDESLGWGHHRNLIPADILNRSVLASDAELRAAVHASRPGKLLRIAELARAHQEAGTKLLVWSHFVPTIQELVRLLAPYGVASITGATAVDDETAATDRIRELAKFRADPTCTVLVATPQTLGEGVSLHKACQAQVFADRLYNAGLYLQALDRTHRVGMPEGTHARATVLVAKDTLDEHVDAALRRKITTMQDCLDDPSLNVLTMPDETTPAALPDEAVSLLLAHLRDSS
jgi:superfamily II DNA or RNA helicase